MKIFISIVFQLTGLMMNAQLVDVFHEEFATGPIGELPEGFTVYRIYARLDDAEDKIVAVYGSEAPSPDHRLSVGSMNPGIAIWNHNLGSVTGNNLDCGLVPFFPELIYDSFVTFNSIGNSNADPCYQCEGITGPIITASFPLMGFEESFGTESSLNSLSPDFLSWNATWTISGFDNACTGLGQPPDNRVLLAQVTVPTGSLAYCLNIYLFDNSDSDLPIAYSHGMDGPPGEFAQIPETDGSEKGLCFEGIVSIESNAAENENVVSIQPNPSRGEDVLLSISKDFLPCDASVFSVGGKELMTWKNITQQNAVVPMNTLAPGYYLLKAINRTGSSCESGFVIE